MELNMDNPPRESTSNHVLRCDRCHKDIPRETLFVIAWKRSLRVHDRIKYLHPVCAEKWGLDPMPLPPLDFQPSRWHKTAPKAWSAQYKRTGFEILEEKGEYAVIRDGVCWFTTCKTFDGAVLAARQEVFMLQQHQPSPEKFKRKNERIRTNCVATPKRFGENRNVQKTDRGDVPGQLTLFSAKESVMAKATVSTSAAKSAKSTTKSETKETKAPKVTSAATNEEIAAAVAGTLEPRDTKGSKNQDALSDVDDNGRPKGRPLGVTTGLPILLAWCLAFQENQKPKSRLVPSLGQQSDEAITKFMKSEFPGRATPAFDHPQLCRRDYNTGKFTKNAKPKVQSQRFDDNGDVIPEGKRTAPKPAGKTAASKPAAGVAKPTAKPAAGKPVAAVAKPKAVVKKQTVNA